MEEGKGIGQTFGVSPVGQGLHVAPRREDAIAGMVGFSGRLMEPDLLVDEVLSRPPILLIHGDQDDVVPIASLPEAADGQTDRQHTLTRSHIVS